MLGYIKVCKPELRMKEYEMYQAVYCSLCRYLGKHYGVLTRFTLNYDFTFLALLRLALAEDVPTVKRKCCGCNPLKKCNYCEGGAEAFSFASAASVILVYYKLLDNIKDERGGKRLAARVLKGIFGSAHKKAAREYPQIEEIVRAYAESQQQAESDPSCDTDRACEPTAKALSELFRLCGGNESDIRALSRLGYFMGRYIYLSDAVCDLERDRKEGKFNPLKNAPDAKERAERNLYLCIHESIQAFELIEIRQFKNLLGNIIYMGLEDTFKRSLSNERSVSGVGNQ